MNCETLYRRAGHTQSIAQVQLAAGMPTSEKVKVIMDMSHSVQQTHIG